MRLSRIWLTVCLAVAMVGMAQKGRAMAPSFGDDVAFMKRHTEIIVLSHGEARVAVAPALQGRVMTSSADGETGRSFGWINRELFESGKTRPQINAYGGEDRFWMGPEGGQFSIFFKKGDAFEFKNWQTPALVDTEPFDIVSKSAEEAALRKIASITNYSGTKFDIQIDRQVRLLPADAARRLLGVELGAGVRLVAYESNNKITNRSDRPWKKETGLLSIWILGMFNPSPQTTIVIPFKSGSAAELGPQVIDDYFGKVPADRLIVKNNVLFFNGDGKVRGKIGLTPRRALPVAGSYDALAGVLTIIQYDKPAGVTDYVNSKWEIQKEPYHGDVVNSYNDGPPAPGAKPLGPFYELETSSPARPWRPAIRFRTSTAPSTSKGARPSWIRSPRPCWASPSRRSRSALPEVDRGEPFPGYVTV